MAVSGRQRRVVICCSLALLALSLLANPAAATRASEDVADATVTGRDAPGERGVTDENGSGNATASADAAIRVTSASVPRQRVDAGDLAVVETTLTNNGSVTNTTVVAVTLGSETVAGRPVTVPAGGSRRVVFAIPADANGTLAVDGTVAGELTVTDGRESASPTASPSATDAETDDAIDDENDDATDAETEAENDATDDPSDETTHSPTETSSDGGGVSVPNPLALWPGGALATTLVGIVAIVVATYAVLKAIAIYLGY